MKANLYKLICFSMIDPVSDTFKKGKGNKWIQSRNKREEAISKKVGKLPAKALGTVEDIGIGVADSLVGLGEGVHGLVKPEKGTKSYLNAIKGLTKSKLSRKIDDSDYDDKSLSRNLGITKNLLKSRVSPNAVKLGNAGLTAAGHFVAPIALATAAAPLGAAAVTASAMAPTGVISDLGKGKLIGKVKNKIDQKRQKELESLKRNKLSSYNLVYKNSYYIVDILDEDIAVLLVNKDFDTRKQADIYMYNRALNYKAKGEPHILSGYELAKNYKNFESVED